MSFKPFSILHSVFVYCQCDDKFINNWSEEMTTKPPASVHEFSPESLEKIAYLSVSTIPTEEPNDRNRLGYHVYRWLVNKEGTLEQAVVESGSNSYFRHGSYQD